MSSHTRTIRTFEKAFTLVELLIVVGIIGTLTSLGLASYSSYNAGQIVRSSEANVATMLNSANSQAISQVVPTGCGTNVLTGYQVDITVGGQAYTLSAVCGGNKVTVTTDTLPAHLSFASGSTASIFFNVSNGNIANAATVNVTGYGVTKTITVSTTGIVSRN